MNWINQLIIGWQTEVKVSSVTGLFQKVLYLFLFLHFIRLFFIGGYVWGDRSFVILSEGFSGFSRFAFLLNEESWRSNYVWLMLLELLLLFAGIFGLQNFFTRFLVFFLCVNLHNGNYEINNGGYNLIQQVLFFHIGWLSVSKSAISKLAAFKRLIHNVSFYGVWLQIALLYLSAGLIKLTGELWFDGTAIAHVLAIEEYSLPSIIPYAESNPFWMKVFTWATLIYQVTFPVVVFIKKLRPFWLLVGLCIHLSIAFIVGITDFGLIMVLSFMIFIPEEKASIMLSYIKFKNRLVYR